MVIKDAGLGTRRRTATWRKREERMERTWVRVGGGGWRGKRGNEGREGLSYTPSSMQSYPVPLTPRPSTDGLYVPAEGICRQRKITEGKRRSAGQGREGY